ncbi:AMP-dependent synthetase/ligase [Rhodococcus opacus]|uniref:AMP-dependent synthetase/ligase n=1 Tax=Rhodococcus opacus TaxID=37919 RepID=UPI001FF39BEE|nr:AMP-dependent synthetase/ligase [Rhodococcus opacus]UOT03577.1 AMP-dependent synthetase/ligase [Rhodococcus opacus]
MNSVSFSGNGVELPEESGLYSVVHDAAAAAPERIALCAGADGEQVSCAQLDARTRALASAFVERGVQAGDRVAVLGRTGVEWVLVDLAALAIGAVVVPVYPTSSDAQIAHILSDSGAVCFAAETEYDAARLTAAGAATVWGFTELAAWSNGVEDGELDDRIAAVRADDHAMIVYTSGTTGPAKGCILTHRNMFAAAANTVVHTGDMFGGERGQAVTVHALPLAHVFGQTILFACLIGGTRTHLLPAIPDLVPVLPRVRPTFLALVPYALEKIRKAARGLLEADAEEAAVRQGIAILRGQTAPGQPAGPVVDLLGGRLTHVISGGASLDTTTAGFFAAFGLHVLNCYGMTETATAVTVNEPATNRLETVGRPIPGTTVAIADDGEVLIKGANVTPGYWGAAADKTPIDRGGWLHTGDIGELDTDGYLRITGRSKEILVTNGGKNVAPTPLEDRLRLHPLVSNCIVLGDGRAYICALLTLDADRWQAWQQNTGASADRHDHRLRHELQVAVDDANTLVSRAESIREFRVVDGDFTVEAGLLTSSLKLRRAAIENTYMTEIGDMYAARV